ncbi:MAG: methylmalonyl Co-A mutase-associated GTPase MeaB [Proteobacteria bacterium]|nr:methylmalonyl Co-A mutase-associated GTPase MeaB [Pseudomonadota bacterium]MBI3499235.1 methylmalonyl Co-A mutase-associated GTPase MeaB [Pseudomonadota bacterium]
MAASPDPAGTDAIAALAQSVITGERRALARAITLVESTRTDDRTRAERLIEALLPSTGGSIRLGISGAPGVGKSSFIEAFGLYLVRQGLKVAVLAVDPSSEISRGSILGDKTRMPELSRNPSAFIRPSPTSGALGGVARRTREAVHVVEAAGFDVVMVETVGVGQSETDVADLTDMFLLLLAPGGGDELQGLKKGIVELAHALIVNKADGDLKAAAERAAADYKGALGILGSQGDGRWRPEVLLCSAREEAGLAEIWQMIGRYRKTIGPAQLALRRADQAKRWMWREVEDGLLAAFKTDPAVNHRIAALEAEVARGTMSPAAAAGELLGIFRGGGKSQR